MPRDREVFFFLQNRFYRTSDPGTWSPNVDLCVKPDRVLVKVEVPGIALEDLQVSCISNTLRIRGIKNEPQPEPGHISYLCLERNYGKFTRELQLNWVVDASLAEAELKNGILIVSLPRREDRRGKELLIPIRKHGD